ncbi:hypothetical protein H2203_001722 [Taxawa tesnikishii (nom. ined.)]|nr:hypothetical protein H2203_001722 [Dothideales sp. JES 119]
MRSLAKTTGATISQFCSANNLRHNAVRLDGSEEAIGNSPPAILHFIDCDPERVASSDVLLYFHGGGYVFPLQSAGHMIFARRAAYTAHANLVMLEYTLAPELKYPGQLAQATSALRYLLKTRGPERIIIGGDSAGGNLNLGLLAHLQRPHPDIAPVSFRQGGRLRAVLCISPRCSNDCSASSFEYNALNDFIGPEQVEMFTSNWQPDYSHVWSTPVRGDKAFWGEATNKYAEKVLLAVGGHECYLDDVVRMAEMMGAEEGEGKKIQLAICKGDMHCQCVLDAGARIENGNMTRAVIDWLKTV